MTKKDNVKNILPVIFIIVFTAVGFFAGIQYQKGQKTSFSGNRGPNGIQQMGQMGQNGTKKQGAMGFRPVSGEITAIDGNTITVKTQDGSSKIVIYSSSTKVNKTTDASSSDLKTGEQITVIGSTDTNGTTTAQTISIGTNMMQPL